MLVIGETDDAFIRNVTTVFQRCREKNVILNAKKLVIGFDTAPFVGHEICATGINMSKNVRKCNFLQSVKIAEGTTVFPRFSQLL